MKHLLVFLLLLCSANVSAQDVIVKKDGSTILSKVLEVGQEEIKYKKHDNLEGPTYIIQKSELQAINYQNGAKDTFSAPIRDENRYLPNNQNDGTQQYNDNALLALDAASYRYNPAKQAKSQRIIGWVGGTPLVAGGIILFIQYQSNMDKYGDDYDDKWLLPVSIGCVGAGVAWTWGFLTSAKRKAIEANRLQSLSVYHFDIPLSNSSSLSLGANLLSDKSLGQNTLGLGLRYNF